MVDKILGGPVTADISPVHNLPLRLSWTGIPRTGPGNEF